MIEFLKKRPWIWIIVLLGIFVLLDAIFFYVASSTQGNDLQPPAATEGAPARP
jgi:hypothetical protein